MLFDFLEILSMWDFQSRLLEVSTPKYLEVVSACNWYPFSMYVVKYGFLELASHCILLCGILWAVFSQISSSCRSCWRMSQSVRLLFSLYTIQSSAKMPTLERSISVKSFIKMRTRSCPRTVPCSTPLTTGHCTMFLHPKLLAGFYRTGKSWYSPSCWVLQLLRARKPCWQSVKME